MAAFVAPCVIGQASIEAFLAWSVSAHNADCRLFNNIAGVSAMFYGSSERRKTAVKRRFQLLSI